jgi:hypothetical protein
VIARRNSYGYVDISLTVLLRDPRGRDVVPLPLPLRPRGMSGARLMNLLHGLDHHRLHPRADVGGNELHGEELAARAHHRALVDVDLEIIK